MRSKTAQMNSLAGFLIILDLMFVVKQFMFASVVPVFGINTDSVFALSGLRVHKIVEITFESLEGKKTR